MQRPALLSGALFAAGVLVAHRWELPVWVLWTGSLALWIVLLVRWKGRSAWPGALLLVLGAMRYESVMGGLPEDHIASFYRRDEPVLLDGARG